MNKAVYLSLCLLLISCSGQDKKDSANNNKKNNAMIEKFDLDSYEKANNQDLDQYTLPNGTVVYMAGFDGKSIGFQYERLPKPSFCTVYKEFYPNGNLKKKETCIGERVNVDTSYYYAEDGSLIKQVDENLKFGKIKPQDVLNFLQEKGYIDQKTGKGRMDENGRSVFELDFVNEKGEKYWIVTIVKGKPNTDWDITEIGEPPAYLPIYYFIDGETGKVTDPDAKDPDPKKDRKVYREYKGRKFYSEQEWKDFADEDVKVWAKKNNVKLEDEPQNNHYKHQWFVSERKENERKKK